MIWKRGSRYAKEKEKQNRGRLKGKCEVFLAAACAWPLPENIGAATKRENERERVSYGVVMICLHQIRQQSVI